ncbi:uncharacterized protein LOC128397211 [Panonychus citri]|uniref:uncharacterized protein LOC128397211 n=1 Tax=Panonychus citri TaxID=50023 RepID=UPI0023070138|nr:uncharacterized protein LOC128397211 [Panonychus citri]
MLITRLSRPLVIFPKFRYFSGGHGHEKVLDDYDGINRRINPVIKHETWWETVVPQGESYGYRNPRWAGPLDNGKKSYYYGLALSSFMWTWVFYHFYYEGHELYSKPYADPRTDLLSNEYLGIPPDDEGLAPEKKWVRTTAIPYAHFNLYYYPKSLLVSGFNDEGPFKM